jgi:ABC-type lipopolysaccharide export system ATPase subunit
MAALSIGAKSNASHRRGPAFFSPRTMLLDQPISSMDLESRERTYFLIQRLNSKSIGVVITCAW